MPPRTEITGQKFGKLTAICYDHTNGRKLAVWKCLCDCGKVHYATAKDLKSGNTKSCGCWKVENARKRAYKDGRTAERLFGVWSGMMTRCYNPHSTSYQRYGGRGIEICEEWHSYQAFKEWALASGYDADAPFGRCTIERIDNNGGYCPENCRFVDLAAQSKNKTRSTVPVYSVRVQKCDPRTGAVRATYDSASSAAASEQADLSAVVKCCRGKMKTTKGYAWRYAETVNGVPKKIYTRDLKAEE